MRERAPLTEAIIDELVGQAIDKRTPRLAGWQGFRAALALAQYYPALAQRLDRALTGEEASGSGMAEAAVSESWGISAAILAYRLSGLLPPVVPAEILEVRR